MKKFLIIIGFIAVSITGVKAQVTMRLRGSSDSLNVINLSMGQSGLNVGVKDSLTDLYIDGVKYDSKILELIIPEMIESIEVIKGEVAIKEYNSPNGVLLITTKAVSGKSETPGEIRVRAIGNLNSLDQAIAVHRLSDEELKQIEVVDAKNRATGIERFENPVIVIDGKVAAYDGLSKISPSEIESIKVVKGDEAMEKYNAPNGAIVVKTKK